MDALELIRRIVAHTAWADDLLLAALRTSDHTTAWREYAHILGAESVWLARLEARTAPVAVWPTLSRAEVESLRIELVAGYEHYLLQLDASSLAGVLEYTTSAGQPFASRVDDIILHVALHGQYHRGKINVLLRQADQAPAPVDYISFTRGAPAAITPLPQSE
jgi:uncharacterized damage-inducible protein DinB